MNMDYVQLFVKKVDILKKEDGTVKTVNAAEFTPNELLEVLAMFPQDVLYTDGGITEFILKEFI